MKTLREQLKEAEDMSRHYWHEYNACLRRCNSSKGTVKDFAELHQIKLKWGKWSDRYAELSTKITARR